MIVVNRNDAAVINTPHGSEIRPLIDSTTTEIELCSLAEEVLPPGHSVQRHRHNVTEEIYYIVSGTGLMQVGDEQRAVGPGDAIFIPRLHLHSLINTGDTALVLLLVCGPAYDRSDHLFGSE
jgi:mannose-6-phosphate isomerase-like protein (cupin superfamily)